MRPWIRWTTGLAGLLITGIGLVATWSVLQPGATGVPAPLDGWMFEGPALVTFGVLLMWTAREAGSGKDGEGLDRRSPRLLTQVGLGFLALPALTWAWHTASGSEAAYYAWTFSAFALGVPGLALFLSGIALWGWRKVRTTAR